VLRTPYSGRTGPKKPRFLTLFLIAAALPGCSIAVPGFGGGTDTPEVTGSIAPRVEVVQPLPQTLAYSDAAKIGQAAAAALWQSGDHAAAADATEQARAAPLGEWLNAATGSSGTLNPELGADSLNGNVALASEASEDCRAFSTIVTSIGGVHSYQGRICRGTARGSVLTIAAPQPIEGL
jgi:hypothetical protein